MGKKIRVLLAGVALAAMLFTSCSGSATGGGSTTGSAGQTSGAGAGEKVVTIAATGDWDTFMPMHTTNSHADNINELMFDRLMVINKDGSFAPRLAESWETNEASDKITYHLNPAAKWHDGEPVTAEDVVYSAQVASSADFNFLRRIRMEYFAGTDETGMELGENSIEVKAIDANTVEFTLKTPMDPSIIYAMVNRDFSIIPKHLLSGIPDDKLVEDAFWQNPVGSGPCIFQSTISGERVEFTANKDYFLGAPDFDRLVFRKVQSSSLLSGLISGEIDILSGTTQIPLQDWEAAKADPNIVTESVEEFNYQYMCMNTSREYLSQEVRQALSLAINRQVLVDQLMMGEGRVAAGPLPDNHPYFNQDLWPVEYDVAKATEMLQTAGWDPSRELEMLVPTGNEMREKTAILVQQDLEKIGVKTRIQQMDFPTMLTNAREGNYDICFIGSAGSIDPSESVPNITVGYLNNFAQLVDPTLGELGASGAKELSLETRKPIYDEYQALLKKQMPMAFLYFNNTLFAHTSRISNVPVTTTDYNINKCVWEWKVA